LQRVLAGLRRETNKCFKPASTAFSKVDDPPVVEEEEVVAADPVCKQLRQQAVQQIEREDCGNFWWFTCEIVKGCCYKKEPYFSGTPWCFMKS
jgi:hypothetical protein